MRKLNTKGIVYFSVYLIILLIISDYLLGLYNETRDIRNSARMFRQEASLIWLKTRQLIPNINHSYTLENEGAPRNFRTNDEGLVMGPEEYSSDKSISILFLGGSTTETNEVDEQSRFPYLVGKKLTIATNKTIYGLNLGVRGNTSRDSLNLLINHPAVDKPKIIVLMHNINDRLLLSSGRSYNLFLNTISSPSGVSVANSFYSFLHEFWENISYQSNILFLFRNTIFGNNPFTGESDLTVVDERAIDYEDPNYLMSLELFKENLSVFVAVAKIKQKKVILMTQPLGVKSRMQQLFNNAIRDVAKREKVFLIDLDSNFPKIRDWLFLSDNIHLNNTGSEFVANIVATQLGKELFSVKNLNTKSNIILDVDFKKCLASH